MRARRFGLFAMLVGALFAVPATTGAAEIPVDGSPVLGPTDAPITLVEFKDFECGYCARAVPTITKLREAFPTELRVVFKHFPLASIHPHADSAARAAVAAHRQGSFWEMHDRLFRYGRRLDENRMREIALEIGLDAERFQKDWASRETADEVERDHRLGRSLGVRGTPTLFLNGARIRDRSLEALRHAIETELQRIKSPS